MKKLLYIILIIAAIVLIYFAVRYYMCLASEGQPCTSVQREIAGSSDPAMPVTGQLKVKCNFWRGKTCS